MGTDSENALPNVGISNEIKSSCSTIRHDVLLVQDKKLCSPVKQLDCHSGRERLSQAKLMLNSCPEELLT